MDVEKTVTFVKPPKIPSFKGILSILAIVQAMLATSRLGYNIMLALKEPGAYRHEEARTTLQFTSIFAALWFISIFVLLFALFSNRPWLILPPFGYAIFLITFDSLVLLVMIFSSSDISAVSLNIFTVIILGFSIVYEWKCFVNMQTAT